MPEIEFEIFSCPNSSNHTDVRKTAWLESKGISNSSCPECGAQGVNERSKGHFYHRTNPSVPWVPYRVLYQTQ